PAFSSTFKPVWYTAPLSNGLPCTKQGLDSHLADLRTWSLGDLEPCGLEPDGGSCRGRACALVSAGAYRLDLGSSRRRGRTESCAQVRVDVGPVPVEALDDLGSRQRVTLTDQHREEPLTLRVIEDLTVEGSG